ncbi:MAG: hypothetical protein JSV88_30705 [Candidatus Aminicenantes bacterium]|nr:MAG: hypothetical protein JSV88_30705 [Candidatus Aminicenantes bacterium]
MKRSKNVVMPFSGCGFVGALAFHHNPIEKILNPIDFRRMVNSLRHRGPEAEGTWKKPGVQLGHCRLSI